MTSTTTETTGRSGVRRHALAWLASELAWERTLGALRSGHPPAGSVSKTGRSPRTTRRLVPRAA